MTQKEISKIKGKRKIPLSGIFLTHAHIGHYLGLLYLGKESIDENKFPVYCTPLMKIFLSKNYPTKFLFERKNIKINEVLSDKEFRIKNFKITPIKVPHRNEVADTVGYIIKKEKKLIYIPDIDKWNGEIIKEIKNSDFALIDGTFHSRRELPGFKEVPHPPIEETIKILEGAKTKVYFTHINHSNIVNKKEKEKKLIEDKGFKIAKDGIIFEI